MLNKLLNHIKTLIGKPAVDSNVAEVSAPVVEVKSEPVKKVRKPRAKKSKK